MKEVKLPLETINKVLQYLEYRPYREVAFLIKEIQEQAAVVPKVKTPTETKSIATTTKTKVKVVK